MFETTVAGSPPMYFHQALACSSKNTNTLYSHITNFLNKYHMNPSVKYLRAWSEDSKYLMEKVEFQRPSPFQGSCILVKECHVATSKSLKDHWKLKSTGSENGKAKGHLVGTLVSVFIYPFQKKKFDPKDIWRHADDQHQSIKGEETISCKKTSPLNLLNYAYFVCFFVLWKLV